LICKKVRLSIFHTTINENNSVQFCSTSDETKNPRNNHIFRLFNPWVDFSWFRMIYLCCLGWNCFGNRFDADLLHARTLLAPKPTFGLVPLYFGTCMIINSIQVQCPLGLATSFRRLRSLNPRCYLYIGRPKTLSIWSLNLKCSLNPAGTAFNNSRKNGPHLERELLCQKMS